MKSLYIITLDAQLDRKAVIDYLSAQSGFGMWFYSMPSSFFIYSSLAAGQIAEIIQTHFGKDKRFFVAHVQDANYYGVMPRDHWDIVNNTGAERMYMIQFNGYYIDPTIFPHDSGLYCVYRCNHDKESKSVVLNQLLYIGQARDLNVRHQNHDRKIDWERKLKYGEVLCYSYAILPVNDLDRCEAALIYTKQPEFNKEYKKWYPYLDTRIVISGAAALLPNDFVVEQSK